MKLLICTSLISPYRVDWFDELSKYADVTVLFLYGESKEREDKWLAKRPAGCNYRFVKGWNIPVLGKISNEFAIEATSKKYDIIILDGYGFYNQVRLIKKLIKKNIVFFVNVDGIVEKKESKLKKRFKKHLLSKVPFFLCGSDNSVDKLEKYGVKRQNVYKHPFTSLFEKDILKSVPSVIEKNELRAKLGIKEKKVVLSVGRFTYLNGYGKGYDVLINSAKNFGGDVGFYIVGGEPTAEFSEMAKNISNIHFIGFKNPTELKEYYIAADVFVLMTVGDVWGLVINEAMACGLPIITTDKCVAGLELVENGENGYIIPVGDEKGLTEKLKTVLYDDDFIKTAATKSLEKIKNYTIENMAKTHIEIFKKYSENAK